MKISNLKILTLFIIFFTNIKVFSIDIDSIPKDKEIWTDHSAQLYHDYYLMEAFRPINQGLCKANNSDYENWINLNTLADPVTKEMPTSYDPDNSTEDIFNLGYKSNINDQNCEVFEDNFYNIIKASQDSDTSPLKIESYRIREPLSDQRWQLQVTEDVSDDNPYGVLTYDLNIYGLARNNGLYLAHAESKYDETGNTVIVDSITWVDAVIINQNLTAGTVSETYRARINHSVGGLGYGTIIGMVQGGLDSAVTLPVPHGSFPDGIPDSITTTNFAYNDDYLLFNTESATYPGSPYDGVVIQSTSGESGLSCIDREDYWSYVPSFGYGVYDSNGDRLPQSPFINVNYNGTPIAISGTSIAIDMVCKNMNDGTTASLSQCVNPEGNTYQAIPSIDIPDGTIVTDESGNTFYIRVLKSRKVYSYHELSKCDGLSLQESIDTPDHKTFIYLNEIDIPPSGAILYNQYSSGDTADQQYLGRVYVANEDDDGDRVLNFLDSFPEDATKSKDDDYDGIEDSEDSDITQRVMTWKKYIDKDIFELANSN